MEIQFKDPKVTFSHNEYEDDSHIAILAIANTDQLRELDISPMSPVLMNVKAGSYRIVSKGVFLFDPDTSQVSIVMDWLGWNVWASEDASKPDSVTWN